MSGSWRGAGSGKWGYWHGAPWHKGNKNPKGKGDEGAPAAAPLFPAYDNKKGGAALPKSQPQELLHVVHSSRQEDTMVKDLQKALNHARKAEGRVAKLQADAVEKKRLWCEWERQLKQCYLAERQRHVSNLETLDLDLVEALKQQEAARQEVRRVAAGQSSVPMEECGSEMDAHFAALMSEETAPWDDAANEEVLQRALLAATTATLPSTPPTAANLPRTPYPSRPVVQTRGAQREVASSASASSRLQPFPPPKPMKDAKYPNADMNPLPSPTAVEDPYQVLNVAGSPIASIAAVPAKVKPKARVPLKEQGRPTGPVGRQCVIHSPSKIEEMRENAVKSLLGQQTGGSSNVTGVPVMEKPESKVPETQTTHFLLDDDTETGKAAEEGIDNIMD